MLLIYIFHYIVMIGSIYGRHETERNNVEGNRKEEMVGIRTEHLTNSTTTAPRMKQRTYTKLAVGTMMGVAKKLKDVYFYPQH